ncbi:hypothetical protein EV196_11320 [Mariniflexile fucanivorans]|uniref:TrbL/VirB6 plasmid conjugal transfer protein n=1 Tax=Mariniflexile fucanivorans TaxID=264023 RepID=A0A4R1RA37_9FLAO|nr:hypothetical protein [Mariniflexile fucanivorans]TCL62479.1 hypothetical protein EV196_11320 [Mariniflexile fucanivorans]
MNYDFIDSVRLSLEGSNIFMYTIKGAKMCAILLLFFSVLERWGKNAINSNTDYFNDVFTIIGYVFLIISSDFLFNTVEGTFSSINSAMSTTQSSLYTDLLQMLTDDYDTIVKDAEDGWDMLTAILGNLIYFIGFLIVLVVMGICKIAEMAMISGYLLTRVFFLEIMKFLFPIAVALSTIKQTNGLIAKWLRLYIGLAILGIVYIGIIKFCDLTQMHLQNSFKMAGDLDFFNSFLSVNSSIWGALITIIIVFTLKVALFNKATSYIISFFS